MLTRCVHLKTVSWCTCASLHASVVSDVSPVSRVARLCYLCFLSRIVFARALSKSLLPSPTAHQVPQHHRIHPVASILACDTFRPNFTILFPSTTLPLQIYLHQPTAKRTFSCDVSSDSATHDTGADDSTRRQCCVRPFAAPAAYNGCDVCRRRRRPQQQHGIIRFH